MCLTTYSENSKAPKPLIAKNDIVCYKAMTIWSNDKTVTTPYQSAELPFNKKLTAKGWLFPRKNPVYDGEYSIGDGAFHSYADLRTAIKDLNNFGAGNLIFRAIIPAGTKYYEGDFGGAASYASKNIILTDIVEYATTSVFLYTTEDGVYLSDIIEERFNCEHMEKFRL